MLDILNAVAPTNLMVAYRFVKLFHSMPLLVCPGQSLTRNCEKGSALVYPESGERIF